METNEPDLEDNFYLELSTEPVKFESVSSSTNVFFDDSKQQVFVVRAGGITNVLLKGPEENLNFRIQDKGPIISIKFSSSMNILAIQRTNTSVEFVNYSTTNGLDNIEYSQLCKGNNTTIQGFVWTHNNEILIITDHGVELFLVNPVKKNVKTVKTLSFDVNWYVYCPQSNIIILSTGTIGNQMQALHVTPGNLHKSTKFEMDAVPQKPGKLAVSERDVALAVLYDTPYIIVLHHQQIANRSSGTAHVCLYTIYQDTMKIKKSHIFKLDVNGRFAINVVDNLIIVHHQASKTSMLFDIMLHGEFDGMVIHHASVTVPRPIKPHYIKVQGATLSEQIEQPCQLYSPNWVVFQPNIVIDAKLGCLWYIELRLEDLIKLIHDRVKLVEFLLQRKNAKQILIQVIKNYVCNLEVTYADMPVIFRTLNAVYTLHRMKELFHPSIRFEKGLDQSDMYTHIFSKFSSRESLDSEMIIYVLFEYIRSLDECDIPVEHYLHELIITTFVQRKTFYQLHQLLQCHVVKDSKPLACLLLSLENLYPAARQLALDMLNRLCNTKEEIIEVLLSKGHILPALRYVRSMAMIDRISARKFLEAAKATNDPILFHSVYKFFEQRNLRLHNTTSFAQSDHCQIYVKHFDKLFRGADSICDSNLSLNTSIISSQD